VNVLETPVRSVYRWKGKVEAAQESLLVIKSSRRRFAALRAVVESLHRYEVPELIALPIVAGAPAYLEWLAECLRPSSSVKRARATRSRGGK
jgi:periplasmic divalent cation tolerance protein